MHRSFVTSSALLALCAILGCGYGSSNKPGTTTNTPSKIKFRAFVANNFQKALHIVDESKDQLYTVVNSTTLTNTAGNILLTDGALGISVSPVALVPAGTGITLAVTHDLFGDGVSIVNNAKETQSGAVSFSTSISSVVATSNGATAYVAVPDLDQVNVVDIATAKVTATLSIGNVRRLVISGDNSKVLAFSPERNQFTLIKTADNSLVGVTGFTSATYGVFTTDNSKAYILSCGTECGGTGTPSVALADFSTSTPTITGPVSVPGATVGTLDGSGNLLVAGTPTVGPLQGVLTALSPSLTVIGSKNIGDGLHTIMVSAPNGKLYIGAKNCTDQPGSSTPSGCLTVYNLSSGAVAVDVARGDVTGIQPVTAKSRNVIYIAVGATLTIYDGNTDQPQNNQIPLTGQILDVKSAQ